MNYGNHIKWSISPSHCGFGWMNNNLMFGYNLDQYASNFELETSTDGDSPVLEPMLNQPTNHLMNR